VTLAYLGLGSNVGDRLAHLKDAVATLPRYGVEVVRSSSVYETQPVGLVPDQREFLNACLRVRTALGPEELLKACKAVESELGRTGMDVRHGPREIDVDLLTMDRMTYHSANGRVVVPHPTITERRFVLVPLLELDPDLALPDGTRLSEALARLGPGQEVRPAGPPLA
jgi:2-amino-4-hydroxy-6-hydroxymethyldihydropteridine diphosphokinase